MGEGKTVTTKKMMFMYWDDTKPLKKLQSAGKDQEEKAEDAASKEVEEKPLVSPRQGDTLLPFEDYDENKGIGYNVPACWREVPINVDAWLQKLDEYIRAKVDFMS